MKQAKDAVAVVKGIIEIAGENPETKKAGQELGKTALTLTKTINNCLLPLAAVNYGFDKARKYFDEKFPEEFSKKTSDISAEDIVEAKASVAGPALQGLAFSHEEADLKEMYLNLLASAINRKTASNIHPAFVEVIRQLNAQEAKKLGDFLPLVEGIPIAELRIQKKEGFLIKHRYTANLTDIDKKPLIVPEFPLIVDNWVRLGLAKADFNLQMSEKNAYDWIKLRPEYSQLIAECVGTTDTVNDMRGVLIRTDFGMQFALAVGLI